MTKFAPVLFAPLALAAGLALAGAAGAATPPAKAKVPPVTAAKQAACQTEWEAQKSHTGTHKAFIKACIAKG